MIPKRLGLMALTLCLSISGCSSVLTSTRNSPIEDDRGTRTIGSKIDDSLIETKVSVNIAKANADLDKGSHIVVSSYNGVVLLAGQTPITACQSRFPKPASGTGTRANNSASASAHSPGTSASTLIRARTPSPRLVSWVVPATIASGHASWRVSISWWNSSTPTANRLGSPPTSFSEVSRDQR